ncbi:MAG: bifunctional 5,6,7,8-tetrahydromethanopterin hydro-lyase/3-hexulose-6-phosphate synthase [Candidatus Hodarchaeales archaeon]|jgi:bifunctional enzyme Fae/Hps
MADFFIGEALLGQEPEIAHIDLMIGDKGGPVGQAFANGLVGLSQGHTPLLGVIKPNLPPKPHTLIIPKVTVKGLQQASLIFGAAQAAVSKAVVDALEEGIIPRKKAEDWVIVCSVFVHPSAQSTHRIFHYNYGATRLALRRALRSYPPVDKVLAEKDRAKHPILGYKPQTLWDPPYLQVALDTGTIRSSIKVIKQLPRSERLIIEVGTPLIKGAGIDSVVEAIREVRVESYIIADMKTLDVGRAEVEIAANATANAIVVSGQAPIETIEDVAIESKKRGIDPWVDSLGTDPEQLLVALEGLAEKPKVFILHRGIDQESGQEQHDWGLIKSIKQRLGCLVAVAGGIKPGKTLVEALEMGSDIIVVGRYIYRSLNPYQAATHFLDSLGPEKETMRLFDRIDY